MAGVSLPPGSVDEPLAGLLPAAGGAPHVPVFHPVNLAALFAFSSGLSQGDCPSGRGGQGGVSVLSLLSCAGCMMVCRRHLGNKDSGVDGADPFLLSGSTKPKAGGFCSQMLS